MTPSLRVSPDGQEWLGRHSSDEDGAPLKTRSVEFRRCLMLARRREKSAFLLPSHRFSHGN